MKSQKTRSFALVIATFGLVFSSLFPVLSYGANLPEETKAFLVQDQVIDSSLKDHLSTANDPLHVVIEFNAQPDYQQLDEETSAQGQIEQRKQLIGLLKETALTSQANVKAMLETASQSGQASQIESYYIVNALSVKTTAEMITKIAQLPEVKLIKAVGTIKNEDPVKKNKRSRRATLESSDGIEWGVSQSSAPNVWQELGVDGTGVTVGIIDSGVNYQHPALKEHFKGYDPQSGQFNLDGTYQDFVGDGVTQVYAASSNHGTHVTGTILGKEGDANRIGIAPGAKFIAARAIGVESGEETNLLKAAEWMLAPGGKAENAPKVVNNSWGGDAGDNDWFQQITAKWRAAGIVPVFAAGNSNRYPEDGSLANPGNQLDVITVGATSIEGELGDFSQVGPSAFDTNKDQPHIKPDLSAPGVQVRSAVATGGYETYSGTSMAAPHVTGTIALMLQANPNLTIEQIEHILRVTATPKTNQRYPQTPNMGYGYGILNAYEAVKLAKSYAGGQSADQRVEISGQVLTAGADTTPAQVQLTSSSTVYAGQSLTVSAKASDDVAVTGVTLKYRSTTEGSFTEMLMRRVDGDQLAGTYQGIIPSDQVSAGLEVQVVATDWGNNTPATTEVTKIEVKPGITPGAYSNDFETQVDGWVFTGEQNNQTISGDWNWGTPTQNGEPPARGKKLIGTRVGYSKPQVALDSYAVMPPIDLTSTDAKNPALSFDEYLGFNGVTGAEIQVSESENGPWVKLDEKEIPIDAKPAWTRAHYNLKAYVGKKIFIRFYFHYADHSTGPGWYIDNLSLDKQDTQAPPAVSKVQSTARAGRIVLTWDAVTDVNDVQDYLVYRAERLEDLAQASAIGTVDREAAQLKYEDRRVQQGKTYFYAVRVRDQFGNLSALTTASKISFAGSWSQYWDGSQDAGFTTGTLADGAANQWERGQIQSVADADSVFTLRQAQLGLDPKIKENNPVWATNLGKQAEGAQLADAAVAKNHNAYLQTPKFTVTTGDNAQNTLSFESYNALHYTGEYQQNIETVQVVTQDGTTHPLVGAAELQASDKKFVFHYFQVGLEKYQGQEVSIRFVLQTGANLVIDTYELGWYLDDIAIGSPETTGEQVSLAADALIGTEDADQAGTSATVSSDHPGVALAAAGGDNVADSSENPGNSSTDRQPGDEDRTVLTTQSQAGTTSLSTEGDGPANADSDSTDSSISDESATPTAGSSSTPAAENSTPSETKPADGTESTPVLEVNDTTKYVPLSAALVKIEVLDQSQPVKPEDGSYHFKVSPGTWKMTASAYGYQSVTREVQAATRLNNGEESAKVLQNFVLLPAAKHSLSGKVSDASGQGIAEVWVRIVEDANVEFVQTKADGSFEIPQVFGDGTVSVRAFKPGYLAQEQQVNLVNPAQLNSINLTLTPLSGQSEWVKYDNDQARSNLIIAKANRGVAVRFYPLKQNSTLQAARIYFQEMPNVTRKDVKVAVMAVDDDQRLRTLAQLPKYQVQPGWNTIDLSGYQIKADRALYVVVTQNHPGSDSYGVAVDTQGLNAADATSHSYLYNGSFVDPKQANIVGAFMIQAQFNAPAEAEAMEAEPKLLAPGEAETAAPATDVTEFEFVDEGEGKKLTRFNGQCTVYNPETYMDEKRHLVIPAEVDGKPVTTIGKSAFAWKYCGGITLPDSVHTIEANAFQFAVVTGGSLNLSPNITEVSAGGLTGVNQVFVNGPGVTKLGVDAVKSTHSAHFTFPNLVSIDPNAFGSISGYSSKYNIIVAPKAVGSVPVADESNDEAADNGGAADSGGATSDDGSAGSSVSADDDADAGAAAGSNSGLVSRDGLYLLNPVELKVNVIVDDPEKPVRSDSYIGKDTPAPTEDEYDPMAKYQGYDLTRPASDFYQLGQQISVEPPRDVTLSYQEGPKQITLSASENLVVFQAQSLRGVVRQPLLQNDKVLLGLAIPGSIVKLTVNGQELSVSADQDGFYRFDLEKELLPGDKLTLSLSDKAGKQVQFSPTLQVQNEINQKFLMESNSKGILVRYFGSGGEETAPSSAFDLRQIERQTKQIGDLALADAGLSAFNSLGKVENLTQIGKGAFANNKLSSIEIPNGVRIIDNYAFAKNQLGKLKLPSLTHQIGKGAFINNQLTTVELGKYLGHLGDQAFAYNQLDTLLIPSRIEDMGAEAFAGNRLQSLQFERAAEPVELLPMSLFGSPRSTRSIRSADEVDSHRGGLTSLASRVFADNQLREVKLPEEIANVADDAFANNGVLVNLITYNDQVHDSILANNSGHIVNGVDIRVEYVDQDGKAIKAGETFVGPGLQMRNASNPSDPDTYYRSGKALTLQAPEIPGYEVVTGAHTLVPSTDGVNLVTFSYRALPKDTSPASSAKVVIEGEKLLVTGAGIPGAHVALTDQNGNSFNPPVSAIVNQDGSFTLPVLASLASEAEINSPVGLLDWSALVGQKLGVIQREPGKNASALILTSNTVPEPSSSVTDSGDEDGVSETAESDAAADSGEASNTDDAIDESLDSRPGSETGEGTSPEVAPDSTPGSTPGSSATPSDNASGSEDVASRPTLTPAPLPAPSSDPTTLAPGTDDKPGTGDSSVRKPAEESDGNGNNTGASGTTDLVPNPNAGQSDGLEPVQRDTPDNADQSGSGAASAGGSDLSTDQDISRDAQPSAAAKSPAGSGAVSGQVVLSQSGAWTLLAAGLAVVLIGIGICLRRRKE